MHLYVSLFGIAVFVKSMHNMEFQKLEGLQTIPLAKMCIILSERVRVTTC